MTPARAALVLAAATLAFGGCRCNKEGSGASEAPTTGEAPPAGGAAVLSAPIAAAHLPSGEIVVAGLDVAAKGIRVQRLGPKSEVLGERVALADVAWSTDSDLKLVAGEGIAVTWRGLRGGKLVRQLVTLGVDLTPKGEPVDVAAASCATREALWFSDGARASVRPWKGATHTVALPKDQETSLLCAAESAFAVLEDDDKTSITALGSAAGPTRGATHVMIREHEFGEDEQRELSEYTVGDDVGVVRLSRSGALAMRELKSGALGALAKLKTTIRPDDDVVAVDASATEVVIVYTQDVADAGAAPGSEPAPCTKVAALRVNRASLDESTVVLSEARCGFEVGPFFTSAVRGGVQVAWAERASTIGQARAPIVGLAHVRVELDKTPTVARIEQAADALVDAGCDDKGCYAVALARTAAAPGAKDATAGFAKVLRY